MDHILLSSVARKSYLTTAGLWLLVLVGWGWSGCAGPQVSEGIVAGHFIQAEGLGWWGGSLREVAVRIDAVMGAIAEQATARAIALQHPVQGALFPRDLAPPDFVWQDDSPGVRRWLLRLRVQGTEREIRVLCGRSRWQPPAHLWQWIKAHSLEAPAALTVYGVTGDPPRVVSKAAVQFGTSTDPVGAPVFFQQIPLPFAYAKKHVDQFRWLQAELSRPEPARVVLSNPPACALCHAFSADGRTFGLDIDYHGDKGGYLLASMASEMELTAGDVISWNDLKVSPGLPNMGLFAKLSPDGRYLLASVGEKPFMAVLDHVDFSQLFFPISGRLAWYDRITRKMALLPGADEAGFVQASPEWSPDGGQVFFARAPVDFQLHDVMGTHRLLSVAPGTDIQTLNARYRIRFDIYRVPFSAGRGGTAEPLAGASANGYSNYFPRVSPDGRWIVFTQSATGMVGQPDSRLMIVASGGGQARSMRCNTAFYNSWHSWSPNSRWVVFTSKVNTPYTELFLAHVDAQGRDSPPVWLSRLSDPKRAAVIPEFVNPGGQVPESMTFKLP